MFEQKNRFESSISSPDKMIWGQLRPHVIIPKTLKHAFSKVSRQMFVPASYRECCYQDDHIPLSDHSSKSRFLLAPLVLTQLLVNADLECITHKKILILCGGMGYSAALLGQMGADCLMIETNGQLADQARENLASYAKVFIETLSFGSLSDRLEGELFDVIFIDGGAVQSIPSFLLSRLMPKGFLLALQSEKKTDINEFCLCRGIKIFNSGSASVLFDVWAPLNHDFAFPSFFEF